LPDEADESPDGHADRRDDQSVSRQAIQSGSGEAETRNRQDYYADLRVAVSTEESVTARRTAAEEQDASGKWSEKVTESRWMWSEYQRRWPPEDRPPVDRSDDDRIAELERHKISPAMRAIEGQDPDRRLVGFEHRLKDRDRIKEKVSDTMEEVGSSTEEALSIVPDAIRYTFQYREVHYTQGVWTDIGRLKGQGFELDKLRNFWVNEQYKGINSQWIEPDSGQRFEVQFHTRISFEAKQITHTSYERLRTHQVDEFEKMVLKAFQQKVSAEVPVPPGAADIPNHP